MQGPRFASATMRLAVLLRQLTLMHQVAKGAVGCRQLSEPLHFGNVMQFPYQVCSHCVVCALLLFNHCARNVPMCNAPVL